MITLDLRGLTNRHARAEWNGVQDAWPGTVVCFRYDSAEEAERKKHNLYNDARRKGVCMTIRREETDLYVVKNERGRV